MKPAVFIAGAATEELRSHRPVPVLGERIHQARREKAAAVVAIDNQVILGAQERRELVLEPGADVAAREVLDLAGEQAREIVACAIGRPLPL